jgi:hypothetical protein
MKTVDSSLSVLGFLSKELEITFTGHKINYRLFPVLVLHDNATRVFCNKHMVSICWRPDFSSGDTRIATYSITVEATEG